MVVSAAGTSVARSSEGNVTPQWLIDVKDNAARGERPRDKAYGRWLGDFLDQDTQSGLLPTELLLLNACKSGWACFPSAPEGWSALLKGPTSGTEKAELLRGTSKNI
ncbi:MAG: hypothetical protein DLM68_05120, partial [Hyphomicrobiales bacterium]